MSRRLLAQVALRVASTLPEAGHHAQSRAMIVVLGVVLIAVGVALALSVLVVGHRSHDE